MMNRKSKQWLSLLVAAELLTGTAVAGIPSAQAQAQVSAAAVLPGTPYTASGVYDVNVPHVMINQVYGGGLAPAGDTYASHGFIELYNPTDSDVSLNGWSLQYADRGTKAETGPTGPWQKLELSGTIPAHSSFLITGMATGAAELAPQMDLSGRSDLSWPGRFVNNKGLKVVLMSTSELLTDVNPFITKPAGYVDMLGTASNEAGSDIDGYETSYPTGSAEGTSKKKSVVRRDRTDSDNNKLDFAQFDYSKAAPQDLAALAPRGSSDGAWGVTAPPLGLAEIALPPAYANVPYSVTVAAYDGTAPYTYAAAGLPAGLEMDSAAGRISGTPAPGTEGESTVTVTVTDSAYGTAQRTLPLTVRTGGIGDRLRMSKVGRYSVGTTNEKGGVAEIVKFNKDNGKFYLVNGAITPASLDIVSLRTGEMQRDITVNVEALAEIEDGFEYGDLTSVDVNTVTKRVAVSVQEEVYSKNGRILVLDYDGKLLQTYETGVQPDMIKFSADGRYILTANEGEPREESDSAAVDPHGSVTIVDTMAEGADAVTHVKFDNPDVIDDAVYIRGAYGSPEHMILSPGSKADAIFDLEPEYITLSEDGTRAYVSLQENNAIATIDIAARKVVSVKGLGFKDFSDPRNALDLLKNGKIELENVPFHGVYMPDGIASYTVSGNTYLFTANEGDGTDWDFRKNGSTVKDLKESLTPDSPAAQFLSGQKTYDKVEAMSGMGLDGIYMFGARSFSIWNAADMTQVYDSGSDFERVTSQRLPNNFNTSNSKTALDDRSFKKGPEPESITLGRVGTRMLAFTGLERVGGIMTYDVTDPAEAVFVNYTNTRDFTLNDPLKGDTGPEGLEFIPAADSPTGLPLLLVANEVGGTVAVLQVEEPQLTMNQPALSLKAGGAAVQLQAAVHPAGAQPEVAWTSSNPAVASVSSTGLVAPLAAGRATITAATPGGYGAAYSEVVVAASSTDSGGGSGSDDDGSDDSSDDSSSSSGGTSTPGSSAGSSSAPVTTNNSSSQATVTLTVQADASGTASISAARMSELLAAVEQAAAAGRTAAVEFKITGAADAAAAKGAVLSLPAEAFAELAKSGIVRMSAASSLGTLVFDQTSLAAIAAAGMQGDVSIALTRQDAAALSGSWAAAAREALTAAVGSRPVYDVTVTSGGKQVTSLGGGRLHIHVPYQAAAGEAAGSIAGYALSGDGRLEVVPFSLYDASARTLILRVEQFSRYAVGYSPAVFGDAQTSFAQPHIAYLAARGIVNGTGSGTFSPEAQISRADFAVMLARMAGANLSAAQGTAFTDVAAGAYYASAVQWAADAGITSGVREGFFEPQASITREQMVTMMARAAAVMKHTLPKSAPAAAFADQASIPAYAQEAAGSLQQAGIVDGKSYADRPGAFFAGADAVTREEAAKLLSLFLQGMVR